MNAYQVIFASFALISIGCCLWALIAIWRSDELTMKPLWAFGSLLGFVGLGIEWTNPNDMYLRFGIAIPVLSIAKFPASGAIVAKVLFPVIALIVLGKIREMRDKSVADVFDDGA